jgi:hypothetical protein
MNEAGRGEASYLPPSEPALHSRRAVLILGMHRSGTSALSGIIGALGVTGPKTLADATEWNPRGFFESPRIFAANNALLQAAGSSWDDWRPLDLQCFEAQAGPHRRVLKEVIADEFGGAPLIFLKDPRICRFVPLVRSILAELRVSTVAVLLIRNPQEVAQSLRRRDKFAMSKSILMWLRHVLDSEFYSRQMPRCFLSYENVLADWRRQMDLVAEKTGIRWPDHIDSAGFKIDAFLTDELRHERISSGSLGDHREVVPMARQAYQTLMEIVANGESRPLLDRLDLLRTQFDDACRTFDPTVMDMEAAQATLAAERDELEAACGKLSSESASLLSERDNLRSEHDSLLSERDNLRSEHDSLLAIQDGLADDNKRLLAVSDAVLASTSWRVTAPLRLSKKLLSPVSRLFDRSRRALGR